MKGLNLAVSIIATCVLGYASCIGIVETIVTTLFTDCTEVKKLLGVTYEKLNNSTSKPSPENITLWIYGNSTSNRSQLMLKNSGNVLWNNDASFNKSLPTEFVIHGFSQFNYSPGMEAILQALIKKGGRNIIFVDASLYIGFWYLYSSTVTKFIGELLGSELASLVKNGYDKENIHLIGFSLGANIAGVAGKTFKNVTQQTLPWISGLDPAGPCFYNSNEEERLDKSHAKFVDVMHTCMGIYGSGLEMGHVDFYPNGGEYQPGTILPFYSHAQANKFYAESILNETAFTSVICKNWIHFMAGACSWNPRANMGYGVSKTAAGKYFLSTNGASPFSKGESGISSFNFFAWIVSLFF